MKPVNFAYERPKQVADAVSLLADESVHSKVMAGGQSLGPMLNMRLVQPDVIVDITALAELKRVEKQKDHLVLGACVTHADIEDGRVPDATNGAMRGVAAGIAYRAVRNRGTIGGSLTNADPSADWVSALAALGAEAIVRGANGARTMAVESYVTGALETALEAGELLEAIRVPILSSSAQWGYYKVCRKTGEYAHAIGAVLLDRSRNVFRAVIGATERKPLVLSDARALFGGTYNLTDFDQNAADAMLQSLGMTDTLDRQIHTVALSRAVRQAAGS
ncbi:carbon-monoxide dehydrogenase medium subunit [Afipia massiliensis]|uniref:Carbon-monoxide dehydrogenase medium subunit n=1 Tax=Afipia massiliensis TaxID=211460 RepID=A0A840N2C4_9BRAD|nr:carbon-monoxide dehydrogenase medium subunit [Afipia massiliensis]